MEPAPAPRDSPRYPTFDEWLGVMVLMLQGQGWLPEDAEAAAEQFGEVVKGHMAKFAASPAPTFN